MLSGQDFSQADTDGDGMPDDYEILYGFNPLVASDGAIDSDGDGFTNVEKYQAGTDPQSSGDLLRITIIDGTATGGMKVSFTSVAGKNYRVERNDNFPSGLWNLVADNIVGVKGLMEVTDDTAASLGKAVYRVVVGP